MPAFSARNGGKEEGGGGSRGGNNIRGKETEDLNLVPLEFTFEFH